MIFNTWTGVGQLPQLTVPLRFVHFTNNGEGIMGIILQGWIKVVSAPFQVIQDSQGGGVRGSGPKTLSEKAKIPEPRTLKNTSHPTPKTPRRTWARKGVWVARKIHRRFLKASESKFSVDKKMGTRDSGYHPSRPKPDQFHFRTLSGHFPDPEYIFWNKSYCGVLQALVDTLLTPQNLQKLEFSVHKPSQAKMKAQEGTQGVPDSLENLGGRNSNRN